MFEQPFIYICIRALWMIHTSSFNQNLSGLQYKLTNIVCALDHNKTPYLIKGALYEYS